MECPRAKPVALVREIGVHLRQVNPFRPADGFGYFSLQPACTAEFLCVGAGEDGSTRREQARGLADQSWVVV